MPLLAGVVGVDAGRLLPLDDDEGGHSKDDPTDETHVGEAVGYVPKVRHVLEDAELVDELHLLPDERKCPEDDDALDRSREGAALFSTPVVHHMEHPVHVKLKQKQCVFEIISFYDQKSVRVKFVTYLIAKKMHRYPLNSLRRSGEQEEKAYV